MIAVRLTPDLENRLDALSKKTGRTKTHYVREAVSEHIDDLEDFYLAEIRVSEALRSGDEGITASDLFRELGLTKRRHRA